MEFDRSRDIDKYDHIWLGKYRRNSEARVFKNWRVEEFDSPTNVDYRIGADFGFSIDPSCAVRCWIDGRNIYVDYEAWGLGVEIQNLPALFMSIPDAERWWMTADSSRPETISYLRNHGFPRITPALKGARSVEEGVEFIKGYDLIVHPRCAHMIDELTHYSYKVDKLTGQVLPVLEDKNNHMIDSVRYAVEGARRALAGKPKVVNITAPTLRFRRA
jgi:phage terminase large subunit